MSSKAFYKKLGIKKGDSLTLMQIIQIAQMRAEAEASKTAPSRRSSDKRPADAASYEQVSDTDISDAVYALDPERDDHWTRAGLPAMNAVEARIGTSAVLRVDVERVLPGFTRATAKGFS